jgi:hypothetical protein
LIKKIEIGRCCDCGFNEHGQDICIPMMETYLGVTIRTWFGTSIGSPMLYCMFDPKKSFRDNVRSVTHGHAGKKLVIWIAGDDRFEGEEDFTGEFKRQLNGFPRRCPLEDV